MAFESVDRDLDLVALEERVLARWARDDVFAESLRQREGAPEWVFYEGPPTANALPGLHHLWARSFKDLYPRFQTMRGHYVPRKGGWDCHGLAVELEVEKELGFSGKRDIEEFGIAEFNQRCRESVHRYVDAWSTLTTRIGMWIDTENAYWTLSNEYIESVWWHLRTMWDKGLIYEGFKVVPYCGRCGTALSSHEVAQGYEDITESSIYVRFPVVDRDFDLLVWTTTPWTLISNVAAAVGPDVEYVRVRGRSGRRDVVLAAARVGAIFGEDTEIVGPVAVNDLVGLHYERPFEFLPADANLDAWRVVAADFVTLEDGSGIVHLAPAFGEVDREVGEREALPLLNPVDAAARFDATVPPYAGRFVKDADPDIVDALANAGRLEQVENYTHSYPHCWRCRTPLIYWAKPTWFASTSERRDDMLRENATIGWHPEHIKDGRFGDWLANNVDWALSRDRFWGTPLPFWRCVDCAHDTCVGSRDELATLAGRDLGDLDLHRPMVDEIEIKCAQCGGRAQRVEPVLDAWFDSGAVPAAQLHYPFENDELFQQRFPADFICEAIDQTRGWFYSLLAVNTLVFGHSPYRNVVCLAHIVDRDGQKMSKSRGNAIDPSSILGRRGADALRWYFFSAGSPWTSRRVYEEGIDEATRRFLVTLWNTYSFFVTYANLDGWEPSTTRAPAPSHVLDRWARSRLHSTVRDVTTALEHFDALRAAQELERMVDDLSNWFVRRGRSRFWKSTDPAAHATLYECLVTVTKLLAPFCPFMADEVYGNLAGAGRSVHLADWPTVDEGAIDPALENAVAQARQVVTLGRAARAEARLKVRQPLPRALVLLPDHASLTEELKAEIADELNVKTVDVLDDLEGLLEFTVVPNFRTLGPRLGSRMPRAKELLSSAEGDSVRRALEADGCYRLDIDGETFELGPDDLDVRATAHDELVLVQESGVAVALDTTVDGALRREGTARELVRAINDHRKELGLELSDRIRVALHCSGELAEAALEHRDWIMAEVLAVTFDVIEDAGDASTATLTVGDAECRVVVQKA
ncbi:MAG: isoleucine--tRNA ligase [Acidimicrobiia bacterium]